MKLLKLLCIDTRCNSGITLNKWYDAVKGYNPTLNSSYYVLKNDNGNLNVYPAEYFITLSGWRKQKLEKLNNIELDEI